MLTTCIYCGYQQDSAVQRCGKCGQPMEFANPYAAPPAGPAFPEWSAPPAGSSPFGKPTEFHRLAGRGSRFAAQFIDGLLNFAATIPGMILMLVDSGPRGPQEDPGALFFVGLIILVVGLLTLNVFQWIMISQRGQSIGKRALNIKIVKFDDARPPGFVYGVLLRGWVNSVIAGLPCGVGIVYSITDICFIFRDDRRCIHDLLAQTTVIEAQ